MTPAERMRKYRARKHLRAAWERAIRAGLDPCEVMAVTPIGVTAARSCEHPSFSAAMRIAGRPS